ncbi:HOG (high osmolarity glycerol) pathway protein [Haplosporangium sp. Z 767]|nr:HOG (high osmolarity glycerol) pathway protein [Haplosporangium sp. Z 767]KAF9181380.1 HOG (high osmolarity glycerol) pathway protein [Haplosporangium sp. Z 11]
MNWSQLSLTTDDDSSSSGSSYSDASSSSTTPLSPSPIPNSSSLTKASPLANMDLKDLPDQALLKSLASFLRGEDNLEDAISTTSSSSHKQAAATATANLNDINKPQECDLVITIRDFAYPKSHPYHFGNYPPEPTYEESDAEEDEYCDEQDGSWGSEPASQEEDRTQGHARGLYDFDAENSSELSFKEGDVLYIYSRQFPGWFLGEMNGAQGLVPENYVELI